MEIEFDKDSSIITLKPKKKYQKGHDFEVSFCDDYVCFTVEENGTGTNVQIDYDEWYQLLKTIQMMRLGVRNHEQKG